MSACRGAVSLTLAALALPACKEARQSGLARAQARPERALARSGARPLLLRVPESTGRLNPLVVLLHGYGADPWSMSTHLGYQELARRSPFILAAPSGRIDQLGNRFWRAGPACCDHFAAGGDDAAPVLALARKLSRQHPVDPARVYLAGQSNGGHLAYHMLCQGAGDFAAATILSGALLAAPCRPAGATSLLHVHGSADVVVPYWPAERLRPNARQVRYPGAIASVETYGHQLGCEGRLETYGKLRRAGRVVRTRRLRHCPRGVDVELWTVDGAGHLSEAFGELADDIWRWLLAHPKRGGE